MHQPGERWGGTGFGGSGALEALDADLVAVNDEDRPVLVGVVTRSGPPEGRAADRLRGAVRAIQGGVPFAMVADPERIAIYRVEQDTIGEPVAALSAAAALGEYDADYVARYAEGGRFVSKDYPIVMIESWLRDLATNWKSDAPPYRDDLESVGLLPLLRGGTTYSVAAVAR